MIKSLELRSPECPEGGGSGQRLISIDVWRGVAALAVLAIHIDHYAHGGWREHPFFILAFLIDYGNLGVPLFVLISGFCIHRRTAAKRAQSGVYRLGWGQFWKRRFWRLYPPYVAAMVFSLALAGFHQKFPELYSNLRTDLVVHLLLVHNLTETYNTSLGNGAFWSLGMEEQLYLLYIPLFALLSGRRPWRILCLIGGVTAAWLCILPLWSNGPLSVGPFKLGGWYAWPFTYWLNWALGAVAVDAYFGNVALPRWGRSVGVAAILMLVGLLMNRNCYELVYSTNLVRNAGTSYIPAVDSLPVGLLHSLSLSVWAVAFFCLINWGLQREATGGFRSWPASMLAAVGKFSYSLYLTHVPVVYVLEKYVPFGHSPADWVLRYLLYGSVTLVVGYAFFVAVERHFLVTVSVRKARSLATTSHDVQAEVSLASGSAKLPALESR